MANEIKYGLEVKIVDNKLSDIVSIYVIDRQIESNRHITVSHGGLFSSTQHEMDAEIKPFLSMNINFFNALMDSFLEYANDNNIRTEIVNSLEAKLEAKEKHLEDIKDYGVDLRRFFEKALDKLCTNETTK